MRQALVLSLALCAIAVAGCGGDSGGGDLVGSYTLDVPSFVSTMEAQAKAQAGEMFDQMPAEIRDQMFAKFKETTVDLEVKDDGTYQVTAVFPGEDPDVTTGTWSVEGDAVTFIQKTENGKPVEGVDPIVVKRKDGALTFKPAAEAPFEITMNRK